MKDNTEGSFAKLRTASTPKVKRASSNNRSAAKRPTKPRKPAATLSKKSRPRTTSIAILGAGKLGRSLALALRQPVAGFELHSISSWRKSRLSALSGPNAPEAIIIATRDSALPEVTAEIKRLHTAGMLPRLRIIVQLAGSASPDAIAELPGVGRLTLHPIQTFPRPDAAFFRGITFMVSSRDRASAAWGKRLAMALGGRATMPIAPENVALYHALIVAVSNFPIMLVGLAERLFAEIGVSGRTAKSAFSLVLRQSVENSLAHPADSVLTGPIARGDRATIERHEIVLKKLDKPAADLYSAFVKYARNTGLLQ